MQGHVRRVEAWREELSVPQRQFSFAFSSGKGVRNLGRRAEHVGRGRPVDQPAPDVRLFQRDAAAKAPDWRVGQTVEPVIRARIDRVLGQEPEPGWMRKIQHATRQWQQACEASGPIRKAHWGEFPAIRAIEAPEMDNALERSQLIQQSACGGFVSRNEVAAMSVERRFEDQRAVHVVTAACLKLIRHRLPDAVFVGQDQPVSMRGCWLFRGGSDGLPIHLVGGGRWAAPFGLGFDPIALPLEGMPWQIRASQRQAGIER